MNNTKNQDGIVIFLVVLTLSSLLIIDLKPTIAEPEGASVIYVSNSSKNITEATARTDGKGTITVITMSTIQQNRKWKAYVGNITGTLILADADDYSIYEWPAIDSPTGEVFISRNNSPTWANLKCANAENISQEETALNITGSAADSIDNTFSETKHPDIEVDPVGTIANSTCPVVHTWINDSAQADLEESSYHEVLLQDDFNIVYAVIIDQDEVSYKNDTEAITYDFQALVPDSGTVSDPAVTYYFYLEIS